MPISEIIDTTQYKCLNFVCWDRRGSLLSQKEAWEIYAYRWAYMPEPHNLDDDEKELINALIAEFGPIIPVVETRGTMGDWIYGDPIEGV